MHKPSVRLLKGALVVDNNDDAAIVIDNCIESPIRLLRKRNGIASAFAHSLYEVDIETWKKLIVIKLRSPE